MNTITFSRKIDIPKFDKNRKFKRIIKDDFGRPLLVYVNTEDILQAVRDEIRANAKRMVDKCLNVEHINLVESYRVDAAANWGGALRKSMGVIY